MNDTEYREALDRAADRGQVRGADAVFDTAAASAAHHAGAPSSGVGWRRGLVAAALVAVVLVGSIAIVRRTSDQQKVLTTPTTVLGGGGHRYRITATSNEVRVPGDPNAAESATQALARTVRSRLHQYTGQEATVAVEGDAVVANVPDTVPPSVVNLLLTPIGRLAVDRLDGAFDDPNCGGQHMMSAVAIRPGSWPTWGPVAACHTAQVSTPVSLVWEGRDVDAAPMTAPGSSIEVRSNGTSADVVVHFPPPSFGSASCAANADCGVVPSNIWVVALDDVAVGQATASAPADATVAGLDPTDAAILRAILLSPSYFNPVAVTDLDAPPAPPAGTR